MSTLTVQSSVDPGEEIQFQSSIPRDRKCVVGICTSPAVYSSDYCFNHLVFSDGANVKGPSRVKQAIPSDEWREWIERVGASLRQSHEITSEIFDDSVLTPSGSFTRHSLANKQFLQCSFVNTVFNCMDLRKTTFDRCELAAATFINCNQERMTLPDGMLLASCFRHCNLTDSTIHSMTVRHVNITDNTSLDGCIIRDTTFENCKFDSSTDVDDVILENVSFLRSKLFYLNLTRCSKITNVNIDTESDVFGLRLTRRQSRRIFINGVPASASAYKSVLDIIRDRAFAGMPSITPIAYRHRNSRWLRVKNAIQSTFSGSVLVLINTAIVAWILGVGSHLIYDAVIGDTSLSGIVWSLGLFVVLVLVLIPGYVSTFRHSLTPDNHRESSSEQGSDKLTLNLKS